MMRVKNGWLIVAVGLLASVIQIAQTVPMASSRKTGGN